jgi:hypothetical protein
LRCRDNWQAEHLEQAPTQASAIGYHLAEILLLVLVGKDVLLQALLGALMIVDQLGVHAVLLRGSGQASLQLGNLQ